MGIKQTRTMEGRRGIRTGSSEERSVIQIKIENSLNTKGKWVYENQWKHPRNQWKEENVRAASTEQVRKSTEQ